jgi:hypothetical protein
MVAEPSNAASSGASNDLDAARTRSAFRRSARSGSLTNFKLSERDRAVLVHLVRFGALRLDQVARRFFPSLRAARDRLAKLIAAGQVGRGPLETYTATERGTRSADIGLPRANVGAGLLVHNLAVVDLADWLLAKEPGSEWVTERELRREAAQQTRAFGGARLSDGGRYSEGEHIPDGVLVTATARVAIELELSPKPRLEYERICRWYVRAIEFTTVRWYVRGQALMRRLKEFVERYDLAECMSVEPLPDDVRVLRWTA